MLEAIAGIYGPLIALLAFAILWPIRLLGFAIFHIGRCVVWFTDVAGAYFDTWISSTRR